MMFMLDKYSDSFPPIALAANQIRGFVRLISLLDFLGGGLLPFFTECAQATD